MDLAHHSEGQDSSWQSVSSITQELKTLLEGHFKTVRLEGEVSNFRPASSGHLYFTLKDESAAISAVMFKFKAQQVHFEIRDGLKVRGIGSISVYPQRGNYQIILDSLEQAGEGEILAILEKRKRSLAAEGLFDLDRKKALPKWPWHIALVTSPTGAAVRDILQILRRRAPKIRLTILPTAVQGEGAGQQIAARIKQANVLGLGEVIIVGRGGGSLEDLLPFSEEVVIRAIAASHIPVISAVGHEIDWALSDYVADLRAPTPSAAAELVSANHGQEEQTIAHFRTLAKKDILDRLAHSRLLCKPFKPENLELAFRSIYQPRLVRLDDAREELYWQFKKSLQQKRTRVLQAKTILESTNPKEVLSRGFAIVRERQTGNILRSGHGLPVHTALNIELAEGGINARLESAVAVPDSTEHKG